MKPRLAVTIACMLIAAQAGCGGGTSSAPPPEAVEPDPAPEPEPAPEAEPEPDEPKVDTKQKALDDALVEVVGDHDWAAAWASLSKGAKASAVTGKVGLEDLHIAALEGDLAKVTKLVEEGADVATESSGSQTPLHMACLVGSKDVADFLLSRGAELETRDFVGYSPLGFAALGGHFELVQFLVGEKGAKAGKKKGEESCSALYPAVVAGDLEMVKYLVKKGARAKSVCGAGNTALHLAAGKDLLEIAQFLISKGGKANLRNDNGATPLHFAARDCPAESNCVDMAKLLMKKGADKSFMDGADMMPFDYAAENNNSELVEILQL